MLGDTLKNKKIVISAGASGIGWAITKICVAKGASVYLCDIDLKAINKVKKHMRPNQENPQGGIIEKEMSINMSNLMLMHKNKPVKVGFKFVKDNKKVRFNKINGDQID